MKVAIIGSRNFDNYEFFKNKIYHYLNLYDVYDRVFVSFVSGGAKGADSMAEKLAKEVGIECIVHKPDWDKFGKRAGFIRNLDIIKESELVIAFWDGVSKGTQNSLQHAKKLGIDTIIIYINGK